MGEVYCWIREYYTIKITKQLRKKGQKNNGKISEIFTSML